jgi:glycosyltransferase involved in cell wall biosynthesis
MKILLIVNNVFYKKKGALYTFRAIGEFGCELVESGHEVEMFQTTLDKDEEFHDFDLSNTLIKTCALKRFQSKIFTYFISYVVGVWKVWKSDFVYIYYPTNYHFLAFFALLFGKGYGLNVRGQHKLDTTLSRFLYRNAKVVFTVSPYFTEIVKRAGGNGITQRPGISFNHRDIVPGKILQSKPLYNLLYLGRLDLEKGLVELLEAMDYLVKIGVSNFRLQIVGDGYHEQLLKAKCLKLGLNKYVSFLGPETDLERIKNRYCNADLFILPTHHEGFPRTLYEAMIFGVPIITTFVGGIPSIMKDGINCIRIEPKSVDSIVKKVAFALNNYMTLSEITSNATKTISSIIPPNRPSHAKELHQELISF